MSSKKHDPKKTQNPNPRSDGADGQDEVMDPVGGSDIPDVIDLGAADEAMAQASVSAEEHGKVRDERDRLLYAMADVQNMRRRLQVEKDQAVTFANQALVKALIPIIDNFERALAVDPAKTDGAAILKGLQMVHDQLMNELGKQHVEVIDPKPGDPFDPTCHEALVQQEAKGIKSNHIVQVLTRGYSMHGRTVRPAGVMVAK